MTNRRGDAVYFILLIAVAVIGYQVSTRTSNDREIFAVDPNYRPRPLELPEPSIDLPQLPFAFRSIGSYDAPAVPRRWFGDEMEAALSRVRTNLLQNSLPKETEAGGQLAGVFE